MPGPRTAAALAACRALLRDTKGVAALEFALILPLLLLLFFGGIEVAVMIFLSTTIESAVFQASRFGVISGEDDAAGREAQVLEIVESNTYGMVDMDSVTIVTLVYDSFADIGQPEPFIDLNLNATYDVGEVYNDVNGNGVWDEDMGAAGLGGPGDVVVYQVTYSWGVFVPLLHEIMGERVQHVSSVVVRNEPASGSS